MGILPGMVTGQEAMLYYGTTSGLSLIGARCLYSRCRRFVGTAGTRGARHQLPGDRIKEEETC